MRMLGYKKGPAQPSPALGDALNAGYGYLEVRCLGCDTHQTVALDIVRRPKTTPIHELERYMRCKDCSQVRGYPRQLADLALGMKVPVLMLHGTADQAADGGTEFTDVKMAQDFERALRSAGKTVEAVYYEGGRHNDIFDSSARYQDELQRMTVFFGQYLGPLVGPI
jgi:alpha-beta hydrolase superfamily lysophospholipase